MRRLLNGLLFFMCFCAWAQSPTSIYTTKKRAVLDTIKIDTVSINPLKFVLKSKEGVVIDTSVYKVDFSKAQLTFKTAVATDTVVIEYLRYPDFITRKYALLDPKIIVNNTGNMQQLYKLQQSTLERDFTPFEGLNTSGSISRGVTVGNNQNSVLNSALDLQISGQLSDKVAIRASIQDANIPLQESGYSQRLDEFDQIFIELLSDDWNIRAGDIDLINPQSYFSKFSKRVQGLLVNAKIDGANTTTKVFGAGALVRGQFATSRFTAQEGNQGPYKLRGPNNELFVLIVSGSETVYVNGIALERGENNDYIIDYNAGEIIFNTTYPITSEMRITVDYQFSERNFSRFVAYGGGTITSEKFELNASVYSENDAKNQPLQQNLSEEQKQLLSQAGDDPSLMVAPSSSPEVYNENRILYKKELVNGVEVFVFSNNPDDQLFRVKFSRVGSNLGNYKIMTSYQGEQVTAIETIYEYVPPQGGLPQGDFEPVVQLVAPTKLQVAVVNGRYKPTQTTDIFFELAGSKNDLNLFSNLNDDDNNGYAAKFKARQAIVATDSLWNINTFVEADVIHKQFKTVERLYAAEFNRDWNILQPPQGSQNLIRSGLEVFHPKKGNATYAFEYLGYTDSFKGNRHHLLAQLRLNKFELFTNSSLTNSGGTRFESHFLRTFTRLTYGHNNLWAGTKVMAEDNEQALKETNELSEASQRFTAYEFFAGIGDSTNVFVALGYRHRVNDSLKNNALARVNNSQTYFVKSQLIKNQKTNLGLYINYRNLQYTDNSIPNEASLNSRINFSQQWFKNVVSWHTIYETNSGRLPQQDFTYVEVEPGRGSYTWIDYNKNGIQELNEFEVAKFQDEGSFIRVLLPNQVFIKTHQNRLSQTLTINPQGLGVQSQGAEPATTPFWKKLYNQTSFLIDRKLKKEGNGFNLNPFETKQSQQLALNNSVRNVLFYNRGKQRYTTSYTFLSNASRAVLSIGFQEHTLKRHQLSFNHKFATSWLLNLFLAIEANQSTNEHFASRNYKLEEARVQPKLSYLFNDNARFDLFYQHTTKHNVIGNQEQLVQNNYGVSFTYNHIEKIALTGEVDLFNNKFVGPNNTPVSYQILEGLQPGKNFTWSLLAQKKLTKYLDLNLTYFGRKSQTSKTIHTGAVQLKAYF